MNDPPAGPGGSRRELLATSVLALGAGTLAGCGASQKPHPPRHAPDDVSPADVPVLNRLLDLEYYAIAAYTAAVPLLQGEAAKAAILFLNQELAHAGSLQVLIRRAGAIPNKQRPSYDLGHPTGTVQLIELMHHVERLQVAAYLELIPTLSGGHLKATASAIFSNDAQHLAILRSQLGLDPAPDAFVAATE